MPSSSPQEGDEDPAALLILLTGLPGAGKSSFLQEAQHHVAAQPSQLFPLFGGRRCGRVAAFLQLDAVLQSLASSPSSSRETEPPIFSPERWKQAVQELHRQTESELRTCLREARAHSCSRDAAASKSEAAIPVIFVEDNMHLRSMRERFYRLCRRLETEMEKGEKMLDSTSTVAGGFVAVLELRFTVPVAVCVERNMRRARAQQSGSVSANSAAKAAVPTAVILSMDVLFERCVAASAEAALDDGEASEGTWWRWIPSTQPWSLIELTPPAAARQQETYEGGDSLPAALELVHAFFTYTLQKAAWRACQSQRVRVAQQHRARRQQLEAVKGRAEQQQRSAASIHSHAHQLDLQLRAVVHLLLEKQWMLSSLCSTQPPLQQRTTIGAGLSKLKKHALQLFREKSRTLDLKSGASSQEGESTSADELAELHDACLVRFQQSLTSLSLAALK